MGAQASLLAIFMRRGADGVDVTLDTYPYLAGATYLHALLPSWTHDGGPDALLRRLQDSASRARLQHELEVEGSDGFHNVPLGWEMIYIVRILWRSRSVGGRSAPRCGRRPKPAGPPSNYSCDLLVRTRLGVSILAFIGNEENVQAILQHPAHVVGSDGILVGELPHPRGWGTHVRFWRTTYGTWGADLGRGACAT